MTRIAKVDAIKCGRPSAKLWFLILLAIGCLSSRGALQPGYSVQFFQTEQGLPQNNVNSIIQSRDGYIWLATLGGLVRYDGVRFTVFNTANTPALQNSRITALFEDDAGAIWIGHETGDLTKFSKGTFTSVAIPGDARREPIVAVSQDASARAVIVYQSGVLRQLESGAIVETVGSPDQQSAATVVRDHDGAVWILRGGSLTRVINGKAEPVQFDRFAADPTILGIGAAGDRGVWIATQGRIRKRVGNEWTQEISPTVWRPTTISALLELKNGMLAVATLDQGIYLVPANRAPLHVDRKDGLPPDWVRAMCEDREGNLWAAFGSGGMVALRPARAAVIAPDDRWKGRNVLSVTETRDGTLWVGSEGAGLYRYFYGRWDNFGTAEGLPNQTIFALAEDGAGKLWVSAAESGVFVFDGQRLKAPPNLEDFVTPTRALLRAADGAMLMGTRSGLFRYTGGKPEALTTNLISPDIRCIVEQTNGVTWFGMFGGGLGKFENGKATQFRKTDGLSSDFIQALHFDAAENALWIGTAESGLVRYKDGHFTSITTAHGLHDSVICHIEDDARGNLWLSSYNGVMRVAKADLNRCADGSQTNFACIWLAETDGLPSRQCSGGLQPTGCRTADGALWFATVKGVASVDPEHVRGIEVPTALVEQMRVDDAPVASGVATTRVAEGGNEPLQIRAGAQRLDFDFTAINFAAPERVSFKYRLTGVDEQWIGPTTKRSVSYNHLAPGTYSFRVSAANCDGVGTETYTQLTFAVLPFFWQTLWFRTVIAMCAIALAGFVVLFATRARYRRRLELAERQRSIERERARIAQDIHDDLGSSLTRIILLSQSARGDLDSPEVAASDLDRIYDTARNLTRSLDEIVWAVNPRHDTLDSLATYLGKFAQDFLGAANIRCRLDLPVQLPSWPLSAETRHNVFLAFKEALNNAVKHAQASEVRVTLSLQANAFTLTVEDNGRGFVEGAPKENSDDTEDGLLNMRKRLSDAGGTCEIQSEPNKGTRINFHVPVGSSR